MTFDEVFALELGASVTVSDGASEPRAGTMRWNAWRSHNFTGVIGAKIDGPPRAIRFDLLSALGKPIGYTIVENAAHAFT